MHSKLKVNSNYFENNIAKVAYIKLYTSRKAVKMIYIRTYRLIINPYKKIDEILGNLEEYFDNPNREDNLVREFNILTEGSERFIEFFLNFRRLVIDLELSEKAIIYKLKKKIVTRLRSV